MGLEVIGIEIFSYYNYIREAKFTEGREVLRPVHQVLPLREKSYSKEEFDPGSEGTLAICLTHASRTLFSGSWTEGKEAPS